MFLKSLLLMNYVTVSWLIMIVITIIVDFTGKSHPFLDSWRWHLKGSLLLSVSKLINCYLYWMIYKGCWKFRICLRSSVRRCGVWSSCQRGCDVQRETPLFRSISSAPASESIWHPNQIVRKKTDKKLCCYRNIAATVGRFSWVSVSGMRNKNSIFN